MFELESAGRYRLGRAPLAQALAQVRFPLIAHLQTLTGVAPVQDRLRGLFPYMEHQRVQEIELQIGPGPAAAASGVETSVTWEFTDDDGRLLVLAPGSATLSVGEQYRGVADFVDRFRQIIDALAAVESLRRCDRLGVRYLSIAEPPPGDPQAWARWFRPELTGWIASGILGPDTTVNGSISQTQLVSPASGELAGCPGDIGALVSTGFVGPNTVVPGVPTIKTTESAYLLDIDVSVSVPQGFDVDGLVTQFLALHGQIDRFFKWALSSDGRKYFEYEDVE